MRQIADFLARAQAAAPFRFDVVQADNGPEFQRWLELWLRSRKTTLRHSRVRRPNDNAFIERFNRTIQDECLGRYIPQRETKENVQVRLTAYLDYYNNDRLRCRVTVQHADGSVAKVLSV